MDLWEVAYPPNAAIYNTVLRGLVEFDLIKPKNIIKMFESNEVTSNIVESFKEIEEFD